MATSMLSDSTLNTSRETAHASACSKPLGKLEHALPFLLLALFAVPAYAQLPDGPGKAETERICSQCHELERSISLRQGPRRPAGHYE